MPEDDEALAQAEDQADDELDDFFGTAEKDADAEDADAERTETESADAEEQQPSEAEDDEDGGYVDIDKLMEDAEGDGEEQDNYQASAVEDLLNDEELDNLSDDSSDDNVDEEASAQLDLARAYIDMGEEDEAKEILQQLIDGEDESLSADAKALLSRISS
ncbi:MAG: hypothetical protein CMF19_05465 [Idiomarinaceae bacterium]|nr:hypothetical protein [Idiomarinaceae bacterium]